MANVKDLLVNGSARVIGTIYGNATSANKVNHSLTFGSKSFNGSSAQTITLADLGGKPTQSAVSSPSASGTEISFIDTISQNANGVITATKKTVRDASASQSGVVNTGAQTFAGNKTFTGMIYFPNVTSGLAQGIQWTVGDNDFARIRAGATGSNGGYLEIATADDATEPIYARQYSGVFGTLNTTLTLLDASHNTIIPNALTVGTTTSQGDSYKFYVNGTSYFNGNMYLSIDKTIYQNQRDGSNYTHAIEWLKGSTTQKDSSGNAYAYQPQIGQHNIGGTDSLGSVTILPYATNTEPWSQSVGLYITKNKLLLDNCRIPTTGNISGDIGSSTKPVYTSGGIITASNATVGSSTKGIYLNAGTITAMAYNLGANIYSYSGSLTSGGWKIMHGKADSPVISIAYNNGTAAWNSGTYSASMVFGCQDTRGLLDLAHNSPIVTFGGTSYGNATDDNPKWYFKLSGTSGQTYTFPTSSKTLCATDGSNASGTWGISISGNAATATNADKLDNKHANEFIYFSYDSGLGNGSPADIAKSYFINDDKTPKGMLKGYYNHNGVEYSQLFSRASSGSYGSILRWGYIDKYMYILRYRNGWLSEDWEKMDAGHADTSTNADKLDDLHASDFKTRIVKEKSLGEPGWYRILDTGGHSNTFLITFYGYYNHQRPTPVTFLISHSYDRTKISQIGGCAWIGWITKIRAVHYDYDKFYIDIYFARTEGTNPVHFEIMPLDPNSRSRLTVVDFTPITDDITANAECTTRVESYSDSTGKLATARTISLTGSVTGSGTFDGSGNLSIATTTNHTHNYAGSSSAGGSANSAVKLDTATAGDSNTPVYFSGGKPVACTSLDLNTSGNAATATNADQLDGIHANGFLRYSLVSSLDANGSLIGNCFYVSSAGIANAAHTNHSALLNVNGLGTPFQLQIPDSSVLYVYKRWYSGGAWSGWTKISAGYADSAGNASSASKVNNKLTVGSKTYDGSAAVTIAASDLGLASAMLFLGTTTTAITDGAKTNPVAIGGSNKTVTAGNVVLYGSKEFVWTGSAWEELGNEGSYKIVQAAVGDPSASGTSNTFIATISQDTNGKITATKKTVAVTNSAPTLSWGATSTIGTVAGTNLQVTMPTNPNTWRGIQNNLTSDSTTDSLSAAQGKALKALIDEKAASNHTHSYLPLSGGTLTGTLALDGGADLNLKPPSSGNDSGDIVFFYSNGQEKMRIWTNNTYSGYCGPNFRLYKEDGTALGSSHLWAAGESVTGAVWNDYAEYREADTIQGGRCVREVGDDTLALTTKRLMRGCSITSDTWGFAQGETDKAKTPIAVAGRVLAYPLEDRELFKEYIGYSVCSGPDGTVSLMTEEEELKYPWAIVGTVSAVPDYEEWGGGEMADRPSVKVDGRIWIKVK